MSGDITEQQENGRIDSLAEAILQTVPPIYRRIVKNNEMADGTVLCYPKVGVLLVLWRYGPLPLSTVAQRLSYSKQNLTTLTDQLEAAGLVKRVPDDQDRRVTNLEITEAGSTYLMEGKARMKQTLIEELEQLDEADIEALHASFETVRAIFIKTVEARRKAPRASVHTR